MTSQRDDEFSSSLVKREILHFSYIGKVATRRKGSECFDALSMNGKIPNSELKPETRHPAISSPNFKPSPS
jgi:hypothetical protein